MKTLCYNVITTLKGVDAVNNKDLLKVITAAYYSDHFEETINSLLKKNPSEKEHLLKLIAACCGVELEHYSETNFAKELNYAIQSYSTSYKIVTKIRECSMDCTDSQGRTCCQKSCAFDAILVDESKHTTYIDNTKCIDCGFCIEACPNKNFADKIEFLPMSKLLKKNTLFS